MAAMMLGQRVQQMAVSRRTATRCPLARQAVVRKAVEQETETTTSTPSGLDFTASRQGAEGYVEKDTAGQSNMYPTVTRPYEAGSSADSAAINSLNTGYAIGAGVLAVGLVAAGLLAQPAASNRTAAALPEAGSYLALSQYSAKFSEELGLNSKPAPAVAVEVEQPSEVPAVEAVAAAPADA